MTISKIYQAPLASGAYRTPIRRSTASSRGCWIGKTPAQPRWREFHYESGIDRNFLLLALTRPDLWDIEEQPAPVTYRDAIGRQRRHYFDFRLSLQNGGRIAIAVKPSARVMASGFLSELRYIRASVTSSFADHVYLVSERDICPKAVAAAKQSLALMNRSLMQEAA